TIRVARVGPKEVPAGPKSLAVVNEADVTGSPPLRMGYRPDGKYLWLVRPKAIAVADGTTGQGLKSWPVDGNVGHVGFGQGKELYVTVSGGKFQAWDWEKGEVLREFQPDEKTPLHPTDFSTTADPNRLLVFTSSPFLMVWDVAKWKDVERFMPYPGETVANASPYPDGKRVLLRVVGKDGTRLLVWEVATRREVFRLDTAAAKGAFRTEVAPDGKWIVAFTPDGGGQAFVWDGRTGQLAHTVPGVRTVGVSGGFTPGGNHFILCERGNRRCVLKLEDGSLTEDSGAPAKPVHAAAAPLAGQFATVDADRKLRIWRYEIDSRPAGTVGMPAPKGTIPKDTPTDRQGFLKESQELPGGIVSSVFSTDGKRLFVATQKGTVHVLNAATLEESAKYTVSNVRLLSMTLQPKGLNPINGAAIPERLHVLDDEKHVHVWDIEKGTRIRDNNLAKALPDVSSTSHIVVAPNDTHLMLFDEYRTEGFSWDLRKGAQGAPPGLSRPPFNTGTRLIAYSTDGSIAAAVAARKLLVFKPASGAVKQLDLSLTPTWVGVGADAGVVAVADRAHLLAYDFNTGKEVLSVIDPHRFGGFSAAMIPNGSGVVTVGQDSTLRVWNTRTGAEATSWRQPRLGGKGLTVSPDGKFTAVWRTEANSVSLHGLPELKGK
ncbi:MAG TPA: WD40 repeat domain-containing protein, partial [Gemmataceae bacterium]|nr:WD40 repeat domain-containing protein [Gemmataceae bacterium]